MENKKKNNNLITVTKTFFPPLDEYHRYLQQVWDNEWLTNRGSLLLELENQLKAKLNVPYIIAMTNGTLPIQIALKSIGQKGEIITTPFSYVATTASIVWEGFTPVFVDIDSKYLTIDENKIEAAITTNTKAILATHVYGNPCHIEKIERIAKKYSLKVIYDAAHCFGVKYKNKSIFNYGDISTCSFHATKVFHTGEGGAIFCTRKDTFQELYYKHNFGHNGPLDFYGLGINAKMSELQAAMGLSVLPYMDSILNERKRIVNFYDQNLDFEYIKKMEIRSNTDWNYSYYPIIFNSEEELLKVEKELNFNGIIPRRYFYPSLNSLAYVKKADMPVTEGIAKTILCLPIYSGLKEEDMQTITNIILKNR